MKRTVALAALVAAAAFAPAPAANADHQCVYLTSPRVCLPHPTFTGEFCLVLGGGSPVVCVP